MVVEGEGSCLQLILLSGMLSLESDEGSLWPVGSRVFLLLVGGEVGTGVSAFVKFVFPVGVWMAIGVFICGNIGGGLLLSAFI